MAIKQSNQDVIDYILLAALALSFCRKDRALSLDDLISRNFTPSASLCRAAIARLLKSRRIDVSLYNEKSTRKKIFKKRFLLVNNPAKNDIKLDQLILKLVSQIKQYIEAGECGKEDLRIILVDVLAGECIQYANFYAARNNITIYEATTQDAKLKMLLLNVTCGQIFMLLWRAIKLAEKNTTIDRHIQFSVIMDHAYELYNWYRSRNIDIEVYSWPKALRRSYLSSLLIYDVLQIYDVDISYGVWIDAEK